MLNLMRHITWILKRAIEIARGNRTLLEAISDYHSHQSRAHHAHANLIVYANLEGGSLREARSMLANQFADENGDDFADGIAYLDWLLAEAARFQALDAKSTQR